MRQCKRREDDHSQLSTLVVHRRQQREHAGKKASRGEERSKHHAGRDGRAHDNIQIVVNKTLYYSSISICVRHAFEVFERSII